MITDIYNRLTTEQKKLLDYAFENKISQLVELKDSAKDKFIGVYLMPTDSMIIEEEENNWYIGRWR